MLINIFKTVLKDENEADKMLMVEDYPQVWYEGTTTDDEPEGVLNSYKYNS